MSESAWAATDFGDYTKWSPSQDNGRCVKVGFPIKEIKVVGDKLMLLNADTNEWTFFDGFEVKK